MRTPLTVALGIDAPLVGFNRSPEVVAAVSRAGGLGVLAATQFTPDQLDEQLSWIANNTDGRPFGIDLLVPYRQIKVDDHDRSAALRSQIPTEHAEFVDGMLNKYDVPELADAPDRGAMIAENLTPEGAEALLEVAFSHPIKLVANALGPPPPHLVERAKAHGVLVAALVGQRKHAVRQIDAGVDVLIAQGTEAAGHTGSIATMVLTPDIVDAAEGRPVLAAGGIASGRQMAAALALGAQGVWTGSVWLSTREDITPMDIKQKFLAADSADTLRSRTRTGKPCRQLRSSWHDEWDAPDAPTPLPMPLQSMLVHPAWQRIDAASGAGQEGARRLQSFFIGQVVGSFTELRGAEEVARTMIAECDSRLRELAGLVGTGG
ncbi:NAD(P)H-dependent flavin oxidoreductase YrpB (nitropropane dioxygenase family) [Nocardioides sp. J9]|nr:NAD(P)H-dependent flavin oxidoreductase YrpB (nitropropane dioxygenase family) [Nocardioides sp. J9]